MSYPSDWQQLRQRVFRRDNYECQSCGRRGGDRGDAELHPHHLQPRSDGGSDELSNLVTLCSRCHSSTHDNPHLDRGHRGHRRRRRRGSPRRRRRTR